MARWPTTWIEAAMTALVTWETYDRDVQAWGVLDAVVPLILKPKPATEEASGMGPETVEEFATSFKADHAASVAAVDTQAKRPIFERIAMLEERVNQQATEIAKLYDHLNHLNQLVGIGLIEPPF